MAEFLRARSYGAVHYSDGERALLNHDLEMVRCGSIGDFRHLSRVSQDAIEWAVGTIAAQLAGQPQPHEQVTVAVRRIMDKDNPIAYAVLDELYPTPAAFSDRVKRITTQCGSLVQVIWTDSPPGDPP